MQLDIVTYDIHCRHCDKHGLMYVHTLLFHKENRVEQARNLPDFWLMDDNDFYYCDYSHWLEYHINKV